MPRNLPPCFHAYIVRARRRRAFAAVLLVTCLLIGALAQTQLPHQIIATLKPIGSELGIRFSQLPVALSERVPNFNPQLPTGQLAAASAAATSFPSRLAETARNLFCRYLSIGCAASLAADGSRISQENLTNIGVQQHATTSQIVKQPAPISQTSPSDIARSATTSSQVVVSNAHSSPSPSSAPASQPSERIVERIIEPEITYFDARLAALEVSIAQRISSMDNANATSFRSVSSGGSPTSVAASIITGTISNAIDTAAAAVASLTATELVATNATTSNLYVSGTATIGSDTGLLQSNTGVISALANGSNGQVLKVVGGNLAWSSDLTGGGGGASAWATTTDDLALYPADTTDVVLIGASATSTTGNILEVSGNSLLRGTLTTYGAATAPTFTATSSSATSTFPRLNVSGSLGLGSDYVTDLAGSGLTISSGALTLDTSGTWSGNLGGYTTAQLIAAGFSTTSADAWSATRNFFSTTSANYWETQQTARTADDLTNNSIEDLQDVAAITENYGDLFFWNGSAWADIATSSLAINTSNLVEGSNLFFTDARVQSFIHASSTIPKTYTANAFTGLQTFANASTTVLSATSLCLSTDCRTSWSAAGSSFEYLFPANATSTLLGFNGGITAYASSTIGNGNQAGGLTISGGATTTGTLAVQGSGTSTFAGDISISGSIVPMADNTYSLGSASRVWKDLFVGPGSIYLNGKKILEDVSNVITFSTDANQNLAIQTTGTGNITSEATGSGNHNILTGSGNINVTSSGAGSINISSVSGNAILSGTSHYLNFGALPGEDGYGIRDNAGTMEFKDSGGSWRSFLPATGLQSITFADGTTQTTAGGGVTEHTISSCSITVSSAGTYTCTTPSCSAGYVRSGCSVADTTILTNRGSATPTGASPNGTAACTCKFAGSSGYLGSGATGACYTYCVK